MIRYAVLLGLMGLVAGSAAAQVPAPFSKPVRIGVITDMNGGLSAQTGAGSVVAVQLAVDDCLTAECRGMTIEVLSADHQNKPDVAVGIVREWFDTKGVDVVTDIVQAAVQIAVQHETAARGKLALFPGGTARLSNEDCAPATSVVWMWDTYGQAVGIAKPLAKPGSTWFFITADYAFGLSLQADATSLITAAGGRVIGAVRHPFNNPGDFSSYLLQAQASGADVIALGSTGADLISLLKQAQEFGIGVKGTQKVASFVLTVPDIAALGLGVAQGVLVNEAFYWDTDDGTRAFARRFAARNGGRMPSTIQAGDYSVVRAYLKAVAGVGTTETAAVMKRLHETAIDDPLVRDASLRADGRMVHDTYLFRVKTPAQSTGPYDFYERVATIPAAEAFRPLEQSLCPAMKKNGP